MSNNLLPVKLYDYEIVEKLHNATDFRYSISEGGYVSNDNSVILISDRQPYVGMLMQFIPEVEQSTINFWIDKLCDMFGIKQ